MSNTCPLCRKNTYEEFSGAYFSYSGFHCIDCGYYDAKRNGERVVGFAVLVQCEKCNDEMWLPDFPSQSDGVPLWKCLSCGVSNNVLVTIKKRT